MDFSVPYRMTYGLIPAVSYNGNPWGTANEIKGFSKDGKPWTVAYHRVGVCGGTYSEGENWSVALWAKEGFTGACALIPRESGVIHRLVAPEEETPQVYIFRDTFTGPFEAVLGLEESQNYRITAFLLVRPNYQPRFGWHRMLDEAWRQHNYFTDRAIVAKTSGVGELTTPKMGCGRKRGFSRDFVSECSGRPMSKNGSKTGISTR